MTATGEEAPWPLEPVLPPGQAPALAADVLEEEERPTLHEEAAGLGQGARWVLDRAEDEG
jgi:hypothetical protein